MFLTNVYWFSFYVFIFFSLLGLVQGQRMYTLAASLV